MSSKMKRQSRMNGGLDYPGPRVTGSRTLDPDYVEPLTRDDIIEFLDELSRDDAQDLFECYIDPAGPFRYCGSFDAHDAFATLMREGSEDTVARAVLEWRRDQ